MSDFISRAELLAALERVGKDARDYAHGEYDSVKRAQYEAKAEVCVELAAALTLPAKSLAQQCREADARGEHVERQIRGNLARAAACEYPFRATQCTCPLEVHGVRPDTLSPDCPVHALEAGCTCYDDPQDVCPNPCPVHYKATK